MPADQHDGVGRPSILRADRDLTQIEHVEYVGVGEFSRQVEGNDVEVLRRHMVLDAEQRNALSAHRSFHISPRRIGPLGQGSGVLVQDLVEDLETLIGEPDLIGIGVGQQPRDRAGSMVGILGPHLTAHITRRLLDGEQQWLDLLEEGMHQR